VALGSLLKGTLIGGRYNIRRLIGSGSMAEVYSATTPTGDRIALKILHEAVAGDTEVASRFAREAMILAELRSPFVPQVLGSGVEADARVWIAFERLRGETVEAQLRSRAVLPFDEVVPLVDGVLSALIDAHAAHVVHRDIKPSNLFITRSPNAAGSRVRVLDFGVSKWRPPEGLREATLTAAGDTLGSYAYMAPEQVAASRVVDARADLYALGVVLCRCLAGRFPFFAPTPLALISLKLNCVAPRLAELTGQQWPEPLEQFLCRLLARGASDRWQTAEEAREAWRSLRVSVPPQQDEQGAQSIGPEDDITLVDRFPS
jgi:serine/threonine-protein kinase